jgi:hypothetical protein
MATRVDPAKIWQQADCFYQALAMLCNAHPDNTQLGVMLGEPVMVMGALTIELFFKCLVCIETGAVPHTHNLKDLFDKLSEQTRKRIQRTWDDDICVHRAKGWDQIETALGQKVVRDLPGALSVASNSFELIRYSYKGNTAELQYFLQDLPQLLGRVILEMKPEWKDVRRTGRPAEPAARH